VSNYVNDSLVYVHPFTRQHEGDEVVIGRPEISVFLALPPDAVELLDYLADGKTVGEAQLLYKRKYDETPDIKDLLDILEEEGFVQKLAFDVTEQSIRDAEKKSLLSARKTIAIKFHFKDFPQSIAQKLLNRRVLIGCGGLICLSLLIIIIEPSIIPGWNAFFFNENITAMRLILIAIDCTTLFLHEMAHLVAARSVGVSSRLGISNRLWYLVAETDMTGIWGISREKRYLPILAGSLFDSVSASILILILFVGNHRWLIMSPIVYQLGQATLLIYLMRLLWQCYLFVRTDFYFLISNFFRCKNLMQDTEVFLSNQLAYAFPWIHRVDQSNIPIREMNIIRYYSFLYVLGRIVAIWSLIFIFLPLIWNYLLKISSILSNGSKPYSYVYIDALLMTFLVLGPQLLGLGLWLRSFRIDKFIRKLSKKFS
jgi:putative peptide zinc metalloprotease protein